MHWQPVKEALDAVRAIVGSHGVTRYMSERTKELMFRPDYDDAEKVRFEFVQDPTKSQWSSNNPNVTLTVSFAGDGPSTPGSDGGVYRTLERRISLGWSHCETDLDTFKKRDDMMSNICMLTGMIEAAIPSTIVQTVMTPQEVADKAKHDAAQATGAQLYKYFKKKEINLFFRLRKEGREHHFRIGSDYAYPLNPGTFDYTHIKSFDRRGRVKEKATYRMRLMKSHDDSSMLLLVQKR